MTSPDKILAHPVTHTASIVSWKNEFHVVVMLHEIKSNYFFLLSSQPSNFLNTSPLLHQDNEK